MYGSVQIIVFTFLTCYKDRAYRCALIMVRSATTLRFSSLGRVFNIVDSLSMGIVRSKHWSRAPEDYKYDLIYLSSVPYIRIAQLRKIPNELNTIYISKDIVTNIIAYPNENMLYHAMLHS